MHFNCKTYSPDLISSIASEYLSGSAMHLLAKKHRIASKTLRRLFLAAGVACRGVKESIAVSPERTESKYAKRKLGPEERASFCNEYSAGDISVRDLAAKFGISVSTARKILKKQEGIFREPAYKSYKVNEEFFDVIDTPDKAYWFGFILADGCVFTGGRTGLRISLQSSDAEHLESFKACIGSNHPIKLFNNRYAHNGETKVSSACAITISSQKIVASLSKFGCVVNKTKSFVPVFGVPNHLFCHFARGYFDGDGCLTVAIRKNRNGYVDPGWSCVGSKPAMEYLREGLLLAMGYPIAPLKFMRGCWFLRISGVHKVSALCHFLFDSGGTCLPRKKNKWEEVRRLIAVKSQC